MGWAIAIHGGAGVDPSLPISRQQQAEQVLRRCLQLGISALQASFPAIDVAELVVRELEVDPTFNAGRGSALTTEGTVEMEASIMDGARKKCGAVSGISTVTNAISLARLVMEKTPHVYLAFAGAEEFARKQGIKTVDTSYFITEENKLRLEQAKKANSIQFDYRLPEPELPTENGAKLPEQSRENGESKKKQYEKGLASPRHLHGTEKGNENGVLKPHVHGVIAAEKPAENGVQKTKENGVLHEMKMNGIPISLYEPETVGCVVVDSQGRCAAATSTGGLLNKMTGRIGDSPIIGAGTYANHLCAVSATGEGEAIIRATAARDVAALMEYKGLSVNEAVNYVINERLEAGKGGLIAVSSGGQVAMGFNTAGMFRACATAEGFYQVGTWD